MDTLPQANFVKNRLRRYTLLGQIYTKNYHSWRFFRAFHSHNGEIWCEGVKCDNGNAMKQCNFQNNYGTVA